MRRLLCILLLTLLPLHGFAMQSGWLSAGGRYDVAHELEHMERTSHHHNGDGVVHYDDSSKSDQHVAEHSASGQQTATLPMLVPPQVTLTLLTVVPLEFAQYLPDPAPERPQRPPQALD